jgi:hypothetical protein
VKVKVVVLLMEGEDKREGDSEKNVKKLSQIRFKDSKPIG